MRCTWGKSLEYVCISRRNWTRRTAVAAAMGESSRSKHWRKWHTLTDCVFTAVDGNAAVCNKYGCEWNIASRIHVGVRCHKVEKHSINSTAICFSLLFINRTINRSIDRSSNGSHSERVEGNAFSFFFPFSVFLFASFASSMRPLATTTYSFHWPCWTQSALHRTRTILRRAYVQPAHRIIL